jgi:hypothetical protein
VRLPRADTVTIDSRKLTHYCLDPRIRSGRHKARVFREALGITGADAVWFRQQLLDAVAALDTTRIASDAYGDRWRIDVPIERRADQDRGAQLWQERYGSLAWDNGDSKGMSGDNRIG